jgi:hypothetical protein
MLPQMIESLMREQIDLDLRSNQFRPPRFDQRALRKSFNGGTLQPSKLVNALWSEIDLLGSIVLDAMRKVLSRAKVPPYRRITEDLLRVFESEVEPCMEDIRRMGGRETGENFRACRRRVVQSKGGSGEASLEGGDQTNGNGDWGNRSGCEDGNN